MSGWDTAQERSKKAGEGIFIRLADDGDKFVGAFVGEPDVRELIWSEKKGTYEDFDPKVHEGKQSTPKFKLNVFVPAEGKMKVFEMNNQTFKDVLKVKDKYGLDKWLFEVSRCGKKGDTKTSYTVLPETKIDDTVAKQIAEAKLHDLKKTHDDAADASTDMNSHDKAKAAATNGTAAAPASTTIPIEEAQAMVARLKVLPREKLQAFLAKFGVQQVKAIKAGDLAAAKAMLDELEGKPATSAAAAEVDPFA